MVVMSSNEDEIGISFDLICPECGVGNPSGAKNCLVCDKNLEDTIEFMEDDFFDLEITGDYLVECRKKFWGEERSGKVIKYRWTDIKDVEFGSPIPRFIFYYQGKRKVIPLRDENMATLKKVIKSCALLEF
jgi:hypothetical protein